MSVDPVVIGSASGLYGSAQMAVGALCTALAGLGPDPALSTPAVLAGASVIAQLCFVIAGHAGRWRAGEPHPHSRSSSGRA